MTKRERTRLEKRIRAACNPISGLSERGYEQHVAGIVRLVERAKARSGR